MKAAIFREVGAPLTIETVDLAEPVAGEVLVRMGAAGLCHSDLHVMEGTLPYPPPLILGHEGAGIVEKVGPDVRSLKPGDRVVVSIAFNCGHCHHCHRGSPHQCAEAVGERAPGQPARYTVAGAPVGAFLNLGTFAEAILVHESGCVVIDEDMPLDRACLISCGVATGFGAVARTAGVRVGETVAVIGCGGVGLSAINAAEILGASRVLAVDVRPAKLELARRVGATDEVNSTDGDPAALLKEALRGRGVDHVIDTVGIASTIISGLAMLGTGGQLTLVGAGDPNATVPLKPNALIGKEKRIQGCYIGGLRPAHDIPKYVDLYMQNRLKLDEFISNKISLNAINEGFDELREGNRGRSVVIFD